MTVNITNDSILEEDEQLLIQLNSTDRAVQLIDTATFNVIIIDDDGKVPAYIMLLVQLIKAVLAASA